MTSLNLPCDKLVGKDRASPSGLLEHLWLKLLHWLLMIMMTWIILILIIMMTQVILIMMIMMTNNMMLMTEMMMSKCKKNLCETK